MGLEAVLARLAGSRLPPGSGILFGPAVRRRLLLALAGSVLLAALELLGMTALLLLMQAFAGQQPSGGLVGGLTAALGVDGAQGTTLVLSLVVLLVFVVKAVVGLVFRRWVITFMQLAQADTAVRLMGRYLYGSYHRVLSRNSAELVRTMYDGTASVYGAVVGSTIQAAVEVMTILAVLVFLFVAMPLPTLAALVFVLGCVLLLTRVVRRRASEAGEVLVRAGADAYRSTLQALAGAKEIKVRRAQGHFVREFEAAREESARAGARVAFLGEAPRYVLEVLLVAVVLVVAAVVSLTTAPGQSLPLIAIFVAAGVRMLPSAVRVVAASTAVRAGLPQLATVVADLHDAPDDPAAADDDLGERLRLRRELRLEHVRFGYPGSPEEVLCGIDLEVPAGTSLAVVGASGAGKSTLVDLVLGLHRPSAGHVLVDGVVVGPDVPAWQRSIGLVPQDVFLLDDTLRCNVALGAGEDVDDERVRRVLAMAHLEGFVDALPDGLDTRLGERGSRVSGGQRQRIGIARALYVDPDLLVLDEATSALDNDVEDRISDTVRRLRGSVTTLVVAHRLSTVRDCDAIAYLEDGRVEALGTFEELVRDCPPFARLVELGRL